MSDNKLIKLVKMKDKKDTKEARAEERAREKADKAGAAAVAQSSSSSPAKSSPLRKKKTTAKAFDKSMISAPVSHTAILPCSAAPTHR